MVEVQYNKVIQAPHANNRRDFISAKFKELCNKIRIKIKYMAPYMHKENGIAKQS